MIWPIVQIFVSKQINCSTTPNQTDNDMTAFDSSINLAFVLWALDTVSVETQLTTPIYLFCP